MTTGLFPGSGASYEVERRRHFPTADEDWAAAEQQRAQQSLVAGIALVLMFAAGCQRGTVADAAGPSIQPAGSSLCELTLSGAINYSLPCKEATTYGNNGEDVTHLLLVNTTADGLDGDVWFDAELAGRPPVGELTPGAGISFGMLVWQRDGTKWEIEYPPTAPSTQTFSLTLTAEGLSSDPSLRTYWSSHGEVHGMLPPVIDTGASDTVWLRAIF